MEEFTLGKAEGDLHAFLELLKDKGKVAGALEEIGRAKADANKAIKQARIDTKDMAADRERFDELRAAFMEDLKKVERRERRLEQDRARLAADKAAYKRLEAEANARIAAREKAVSIRENDAKILMSKAESLMAEATRKATEAAAAGTRLDGLRTTIAEQLSAA